MSKLRFRNYVTSGLYSPDMQAKYFAGYLVNFKKQQSDFVEADKENTI